MNHQQLCIATISWARDESEEETLRQSLTQLSTLGLPVFITDGGSGDAFVEYITGLSHFNVLRPTQKGLWGQAKTSLLHAANSGSPFIMYTEPDKLDFFRHLPNMLDAIDVNEATGIVLASRSSAGLESFPRFQQMTEATINNCCAEILGQDVDYTYGPFIINKKVIPHMESLPDDIGWGWRPCAFNIAARLGLSLQAYVSDFLCPADQRDNDATERIYRMKQLTQNIQGLVLSTTAPLQST